MFYKSKVSKYNIQQFFFFFTQRFFALSTGILFLLSTSVSWAKSKPRPWEKFLNKESISVSFPKIQYKKLSNHINLYYIKDNLLPKVKMNIYIKGGSFEIYKHNKTGIQTILGRSITYSGSKDYDKYQLSNLLEQHATSFNFASGLERSSFSISALSNYFYKDLKVILSILEKPSFHQKDLDFIKKNILQEIKRRKESPAKLAKTLAQYQFWLNNIRGQLVTTESIQNITQESLRKLHQLLWNPHRVTIAISGDFDVEKLISLLEKISFASRTKNIDTHEHLKVNEDPLQTKKTKLYYTHKNVPQSTLIFKANGLTHKSPKYYTLKIFNFLLGGDSFNSVLLQKIRVENGWAYSIYSYHKTNAYHGEYSIVVQSINKNVNNVIQKIKEILSNPKSYISQQSINKAQFSIRNKFVFLYNNPFSYLNTYLDLKWDGLNDPEAYLKSYIKNIEKVSLQDVLNLAHNLYSFNDFFLTIVGPKKIIHDLNWEGNIKEVNLPE